MKKKKIFLTSTYENVFLSLNNKMEKKITCKNININIQNTVHLLLFERFIRKKVICEL